MAPYSPLRSAGGGLEMAAYTPGLCPGGGGLEMAAYTPGLSTF